MCIDALKRDNITASVSVCSSQYYSKIKKNSKIKKEKLKLKNHHGKHGLREKRNPAR